MTKRTKAERLALLKQSMREINKDAKMDTIHFGKDEDNVEQIAVGVPEVDELLGGGIPYGRVTTAWGSPGCLSKNTFVKYITKTKHGQVQNQKGGTIERLYALFNKSPKKGKGQYLRKQSVNSEYYLQSVNKDNRIILNKVKNVYYSGIKTVYELKTQLGHSIHVTKDHKFYTENNSFVALADLKIDDKIYLHLNKHTHYGKQNTKTRKTVNIKFHPYAKIKKVGKYIYKRLQYSHFIYEAKQNNKSLEEYKKILNSKELYEKYKKGLFFVNSNKYVIHHKDHNFNNNKSFNLQLLTYKQHAQIHKKESVNNLRYMVVPDTIKHIRKLKKEKTYDIEMESPHNNFVANKFIVHNSGKTTLAYNLMASAQKKDKVVYYIALEDFDPARAKLFGVNLNDLIIGRFPKAEQSLDSIVKFAREGLVDVIILDSIQALSPKSEQEEKSGKQKSLDTDTMALLARKLSQFFRVAIDPIGRNNVALFLIGQTRTSVGFIAFDQLSGGNALKHYSKLILHLRRGQKADAPVEKYKEFYTEDGKQKYKTKKKVVGFDCVIQLDKTQITGTKSEGTKIHLPFYSESGFSKVDKSVCEKCNDTFGEDGLCKCQRKEVEPKITLKEINQEITLTRKESKKKRGRPRNKEK